MIDYRIIQKASAEQKIPPEVIEKDYLIELILYHIAQDKSLQSILVFRGGTALRKAYFPDFRYSEDLDFITKPQKGFSFISAHLEAMVKNIADCYPIDLSLTTSFPQKGHLQIFLNYDIVPEVRAVKQLKLDIVEDTIILSWHVKKLLFAFPDLKTISTALQIYDLESIAAEKIGRILDVVDEPRDLWDLLYLLKSNKTKSSRIQSEFISKYGYKIPLPNLLKSIKKPVYEKQWMIRLQNQIPGLMPYHETIKNLGTMIKAKITASKE
ncbi:MAG: nucleotidyl transferase AbiEii/AbiGii toxin family protein [bacterium]